MSPFMEKLADLIGRIGGCVVIGALIGLFFGLPNYPLESIGTPIFILLLLEFSGALK